MDFEGVDRPSSFAQESRTRNREPTESPTASAGLMAATNTTAATNARAPSKSSDKSAADPGFVHLHVHSSYSLLEGALTIGRLAELAKKDRQPALALTDTDNMFGALEFSEKMAASGIQPIVGCALGVDFGDHEVAPGRHGRPLAPDRAAGGARGAATAA